MAHVFSVFTRFQINRLLKRVAVIAMFMALLFFLFSSSFVSRIQPTNGNGDAMQRMHNGDKRRQSYHQLLCIEAVEETLHDWAPNKLIIVFNLRNWRCGALLFQNHDDVKWS